MSSLFALSRRHFVKLAAGAGAAALGALRLNAAEPRAGATKDVPARPNVDEVLHELLAGNARFASGRPNSPRRTPADFRQLSEAQHPFATIIGCADSRVASEILFDVGKGDVFVVRVAGNVVNGAGAIVKGSIEYSVAELNVPLIMVLGHSNCGAVKAAMVHLDAKDSLPGSINDLVELIKPAVVASKGEAGNSLDNAIRKNVQIGVEKLKGLEPILAPAVKAGKLKIVGGLYDLRTGKVTVVS
jgi:carbonic anhydrase